MWIVPTEHKDEFYDYSKLVEILNKNIKDIDFSYCNHDNMEWIDGFISHKNEHKGTILLGVNMECPLIERGEDVKILDEMGMVDLADKYILFFEDEHPDMSRCLQMKHTQHQKEQREITNFLRKYFKCYIFDEGIHPEFILPIYDKPVSNIEKKPNGFINKFREFIKWR